ncbi:pyrethroid hydrolase Ces2e-like isoform X2 [Cylas formicarius]|uniref:pyrethroid hydrolase Ces2e-like isoform X2 n=1 Tax=Cylas formicarius TaxID=197179 RepID=UPI0029588B1A|nr:pyrethroid hydrolase Ces2e-like isoform X2 [Cylas formicarius]
MKLLLSLLFLSHAIADLIVDTTDGKVRGSEVIYQNKSIYAFRGIPFAKPPLGNLRFQAPVPAEPWEGVLDSNNTAVCCIQLDGPSTLTNQTVNTTTQLLQQSEDCLHINVFTPNVNNTELLPVMFAIYGGGFKAGCATDAVLVPYKLVNEGVIVVMANYRLGVFGWLSTGDNVILGNAGFKDQLLALKWVQKNIEQFGGDPKKVTIFGESAGGISIGTHIVNKKSAGLYRAAICQSGCTLFKIELASQDNPKQIAYNLAKFIDPTISERNTTTQIKDFLQSQSVDVLSQAFLADPQTGPIIEVEDSDAYVTEVAFPLLESGNFNQVPLIIGTTSAEGLMWYEDWSALEATALKYDTNILSLIPYDLIPLDGVDLNKVANIIKETYVGNSGSFSKSLAAVIEYDSDTMFVTSALKQAELQSKYTPVYFYEFSYEGIVSIFHIKVEGTEGNVMHTEDNYYIYPFLILPSTKEDSLTGDKLVRLWTNFAKTLNPTPDQSDPLLNVTWPQVSPMDIQYLDIGKTLDIKRGRRAKEFAMWNETYYTYGKQPFIGF